MRSTPLFIGSKLYHVRYDLNAVWDMECLIQGGFFSILDKKLTFDIISDLLWFGLKWDNPGLTVVETRKILTNIIKGNRSLFHRIKNKITGKEDPTILLGILKACKDEMYISGWYNDPDLKNVKTVLGDNIDKPPMGLDLIKVYESRAYQSGYQGDPWKLTPNEIMDYITARNERDDVDREYDNYNSAKICACVYNSARKSEKDPILSWKDFMPEIGRKKELNPDDFCAAVASVNAALGGKVENGV